MSTVAEPWICKINSHISSTSGSVEVRTFTEGVYFFAMKYLLLVSKVYNRLFIDSLGFMGVDESNKHLYGLSQSIYSLDRQFSSQDRVVVNASDS